MPEGHVLVSVIIPAFNAARTITRALDSVRNQTFKSVEVIVVDDGSSDDTSAMVSSNIGAGEAMRLITMKKNGGVSAARNVGINAASGKFLAFLDADDVWLPEKLAKQILLLEHDPIATLVSCNSKLLSEGGRQLKEGHINRPPIEGVDAWKTLLKYNFLPTPTVLTYRSLVVEVGGFDETLPVGEDLDLWIKLALRGNVRVVKEVLINYYDSAGSLMKRHSDKASHIVIPMLEKHISEHSAQLSPSEIREIRGVRWFEIACDLFFAGAYLRSISSFLKASRYGSRPLKSLSYIPRALVMELISRIARVARSA